VVEPPPVARTAWQQRVWKLKRCFARPRGIAWPLAAYLHGILFLALGLFLIKCPVKTAPLVLNATFAEVDRPVETPVMTFEDSQQEEAEPQEAPEPEPTTETPEEEPEPEEFEPADSVDSSDAELSDTEAEPDNGTLSSTPGKGAGAASTPGGQTASGPSETVEEVQVPPHAVTSGRFSAWTEPASPQPGQPYVIIVLVRLPARVKRYYSTDLTGTVIGSDGYRKSIRGSRREELPLTNHTARIVIPIVGSEHGKKDTIVVQSRMLRERRVLQLVYSRTGLKRHPKLNGFRVTK
jgi:hypothetical protein